MLPMHRKAMYVQNNVQFCVMTRNCQEDIEFIEIHMKCKFVCWM